MSGFVPQGPTLTIVPVLPTPADPIPLFWGGNNDVSLLNGSDVRGGVSGQLDYSKSRKGEKKILSFSETSSKPPSLVSCPDPSRKERVW